ncbi:50S ribosomal protein L5 [Candidatus Parcubacteria bacterium]|nr:50S ribosomal protein L5 [Patescibacteria group bacterium]MBU4309508.1 50S ribosomal protein L5 [Patescibacteria group bacterium]MBU4432060.1 50S ribosomal protein L5 [Patescibacteria group bacterium]MBU4577214.1 50S ribosomal protein L5 [Patescibacteria group bacterium]MCG2696860.1 50S ribosomal protein L5 [Candidatus Parcubacteria bacterium]
MLQEKYKNEIMPKLKEEFGYTSAMQIPKISKIVVNVGFGRQTKEKAFIQNVLSGLTRITGQKPQENKAKKAISAFKLREGMVIGASVTLRGKRMTDFLTKLINLSFPGVRDFRGITDKGMDRTGNMTIGFKEHLAFPEIRSDEIENVFGLEVSLATTAKTRKEGLRLFELYGFPFKKDNK